MRGILGILGSIVVFGAVVCFPGESAAYEVLLDSSLMGQGYQLRAADGRVLNRRRVDVYLRLYVYDILPEPDESKRRGKPYPQMYFVSAVRLDADLGSFAGADGQDLASIDEEMLSRPAFQLLFGYLGVTDLAGGWLNLKAGRQFRWDAMDAYQFDGLTMELVTPWYVGVEVFGGSRVNGVLPIDSPIMLMDGVSPTESPVRWAPAFGTALFSRNLSNFFFRFAYRHTLSVLEDKEDFSASFVRPDESVSSSPQRVATAEEMLTAWASGTFFSNRLYTYGGAAYSVMHTRLTRALAGVRLRLGGSDRVKGVKGDRGGRSVSKRVHTIGVEYERHEPTFDGDSIFNIFNFQPFTEARILYELDLAGRWSGYVRGSFRFFQGGLEDAEDPRERESLSWRNPGGGLGVRYLGRRFFARGDWYWQEGYGGRTLGFDFLGRYVLPVHGLSFEGRATVAHWSDDLSPQLRGVTAGVAAGATWNFHKRVAVHLFAENNFGEFYKSDLRIFTMLRLTWCTSGRHCPAGVDS